MKNNQRILAIFTSTAIAVTMSCSQTGNSSQGNPASNSVKVETTTYRSAGVIKAIDVSSGRVTIDHEDIPGYMPPMEMTESVSDRAMLEQVKAGDKVEFELLREGSKLTITKFTKIGEVALHDGSAIYAANCAECHGDKGQGQPKGIPFTSGHALDHTEADFIKTVTDGKSKKNDKQMPAFREKLKPDEIAAVVKFVREVVQKDLKRNVGHKH